MIITRPESYWSPVRMSLYSNGSARHTPQLVSRKPLGAMFGAYVFEGNQIVQVTWRRRAVQLQSRCNGAAQNKHNAVCLAEATFTSSHW